MLYYIETMFGCGIREAYNIRQARSDLRKEVGSLARLVRKATPEDITHVQAMGGYVPRAAKETVEEVKDEASSAS